MNVEELVRESLREWPGEELRPSPGLADRVLRRRRHRRIRTTLGVAAATTAVLAAAVAVPVLDRAGEGAPVAGSTVGEGVLADPDHAPPMKLIAAGKVAMSGYRISSRVPQANGDERTVHRWRMVNPRTGHYDETGWAWLDVAPGLRTAAVLEGPLPARRIGLVDTATGEVRRWIGTDRGVASVQWSPDGSRLLATAYGEDPDRFRHDAPESGQAAGRTGFVVVEVASGRAEWHPVPAGSGEDDATTGGREKWGPAGEPAPGGRQRDDVTPREDAEWSHGGDLVRVPYGSSGRYYEPDGTEVADPPVDPYTGFPRGPMRPDGRIVEAEPVEGVAAGLSYTVTGRVTEPPAAGEEAGGKKRLRPARPLVTWADDQRMIVWSCSPDDCAGRGRDRSRLLLVTVGADDTDDRDGTEVTLSGPRAADGDDPWTPVFSRR
ncbi:hypothetical protein IHE55_05345 [Streptomyces pactum]|uniref:WD40 repeat domain-containing protein n=1 Tax=Streptomyces pactum TaxID=68249 RepID=A0ABS0NGD9_9ACTN|nr:hypothetical protein [Streptomyces pactum]MBH5334258.1 hypothetical protein [Streptomyces pactum]